MVLLPNSEHNSCPQVDFIPSLGHGQKWGQCWKVESLRGFTESLSSEQPTVEEEVGHIPEENSEVLSRMVGLPGVSESNYSSAPGIQVSQAVSK